MKTYRAVVEREGRFWIIRLPELGQVTQAETLDEVEEMAIDLASLWTETDARQITVDIEVLR